MRRSATTITTRTFSTSRPSQLARMTLVGRLGTDPEVQQSANGTSFVKYAVGTSYGPKENRQTSWFRVANFSAEGSPQRDYVMGLGKGTLVYLEGDATMRTYDGADGKKQSSLSLVQTRIEVLKRPAPAEVQNAEAPPASH